MGAIHEIIMTSPLGAVPREIETFYPAQWYDVPVTGDWDEDEKKMISGALASILAKNKYEKIICHLDSKMHFIDGVLAATGVPVIWSSGESETSEESLESLSKILKDALAGKEKVSNFRRSSEDVRSFARFQFGTDKFLEGGKIAGKPPFQKILRDNVQLGMLVGERGMISLTKEGGQAFLNSGECKYHVEIENFIPKANIFAVGVTGASENIRIGDEVVVAHNGEVRAVGVAQMSGREMKEAEHGMAVKVRH
jgi:archaeosine synthase